MLRYINCENKLRPKFSKLFYNVAQICKMLFPYQLSRIILQYTTENCEKLMVNKFYRLSALVCTSFLDHEFTAMNKWG